MATKEPEELNTSTTKDMEETGVNENQKIEESGINGKWKIQMLKNKQKIHKHKNQRFRKIQEMVHELKRDRKLTEKGEEYQAQIREMKEKTFVRAYRKFKQVIVYIRNELKKECSEDQLYIFIDTITDEAGKAIDSYDTLRSAEDGNVQPDEHLSTASRHHRSLYEGPDHFH